MDQYRLDMENELKKSPINDTAILARAEKVLARHTRYVEKTQKSKRFRLGYAIVLFVGLIAIAATSNPLSETFFRQSKSGVFASPEKGTHNISISVSGLPTNLTVEVWGGSKKLAKFQSNQPIQQLDVPSYLNKIKLELESYPSSGERYVTEQSQYDLKGTENLQVTFKKQYQLALGVALTGGILVAPKTF